MSSLSSVEDLATLPPAQRIFIDANIFIYHFTQTPLSTSCTAFLRRVEAGDIQGTTSVVVLAEVAHRLMVLEAIATFGFPSRTAVKRLKEHPALVRQLTYYKVATEKIHAFNVTVEPITVAHLQLAQILSAAYGPLTNDCLTAAAMQTLALVDLASNDPDLLAVPGLTIWQPRPETVHHKPPEEPCGIRRGIATASPHLHPPLQGEVGDRFYFHLNPFLKG